MAVLGGVFPDFSGFPSLSPLEHQIFFQLRLPRAFLAFASGAALSVCGVAFQSFFRNPLATPFTLGVASGASVGAAVYIVLGFSFVFWGISGISLSAFLGAFCTTLLVYFMASFQSSFSSYTLLLAGVSIAIFFSSILLLLQYVGGTPETIKIIYWTMGGLEVVGYSEVLGILPFLAGGTAPLLILHRELDLLLTGKQVAMSKGLNVTMVQHLLFFSVSLTTGGVVSVCGPIGFVGLICPHVCRYIIGMKHADLLGASFFFGGGFLVLCDTIGRTILYPAEIPVGIITSLLGGPFLLFLVVTKSASVGEMEVR